MSKELKPCPFCGGEVTIRYSFCDGSTAIQCDTCRAWWTPAEKLSEKKLIKEWNRRANDEKRTSRAS